MKPTDNIEQFVKNLRQPADADTKQRILDNVLQVMDESQKPTSAKQQPNIWRIIMKSRITKLSAAAVIIVAVLISFSQFNSSITFADVIQPILNAKTIILDIALGPEDEAPVMHDIVVGSRIRRTMSNMPGVTLIIDLEKAKMLTLDSETKEAVYANIKGPLQEGTKSFVALIRKVIIDLQNSPDFTVAELGEKEIDGRKAVGFAAGIAREEITIWADPKTAHPLRIEFKVGHMHAIMKNFEFDTPVDDSLVSMDVPPEYTLQETNIEFSDATEQEFIGALRVWAEVILPGRFPDDISTAYYIKQVPELVKQIEQMELPGEEKELFSAILIKGMLFIQLYEVKGLEKWHYAGKEVKFGDTDKAVFWYRPRDSKTYRVIYGDLSVADVAPDDLPK